MSYYIFKLAITELDIWYVCVGISILFPNMYLELISVIYSCHWNDLYKSLTCTIWEYWHVLKNDTFYIKRYWTNYLIILWSFVWHSTKLMENSWPPYNPWQIISREKKPGPNPLISWDRPSGTCSRPLHNSQKLFLFKIMIKSISGRLYKKLQFIMC